MQETGSIVSRKTRRFTSSTRSKEKSWKKGSWRTSKSAINRVAVCTANLIATGDDEGVVKACILRHSGYLVSILNIDFLQLWDPRKPAAIRAYTRHFDFISDILFFEDKNHLVTTSGDGTLAVMDVRSPKAEPIAQSDDQDDEFLSICPIKSSSKLVVGTQMGMLSIFNCSSASSYTNPVDRIPGHPSSIDALINLTEDVVATGSSDGMIRLVQILPSKLLGVVADHGEYPVERLALSRDGKWLASASHDEVLKMTDVGDALVDSDEEMDSDVDSDDLDQDDSSRSEKAALEDVDETNGAGFPSSLGRETTSKSLKRAASPSSLIDLKDGDQTLARGSISKSKGAPSAMTSRTEGGSLQWRSTTGNAPKGKDKKRMKQDITDSTTAAATTFFADL
ncbi:WD repeat-containing protein jip5 [Tulasnella sp. 330]|nr:WD repeat-containing protein jip5 [Tulasnella sp. 330]